MSPSWTCSASTGSAVKDATTDSTGAAGATFAGAVVRLTLRTLFLACDSCSRPDLTEVDETEGCIVLEMLGWGTCSFSRLFSPGAAALSRRGVVIVSFYRSRISTWATICFHYGPNKLCIPSCLAFLVYQIHCCSKPEGMLC